MFGTILFSFILLSLTSSLISLILKNIYDLDDEIEKEDKTEEKEIRTGTLIGYGAVKLVRAMKRFFVLCWKNQDRDKAIKAFWISAIIVFIFILADKVMRYAYPLSFFALAVLIVGYYFLFAYSSGYSIKQHVDSDFAVGELKEMCPYIVLSWLVAIVVVQRVTLFVFVLCTEVETMVLLSNIVWVSLAIVGTIGPILGFAGTRKILKEEEGKL